MKKLILLSLCLFTLQFGFSFKSELKIFRSDSILVGTVTDGAFRIQDHEEIIYTVRGNIIFKGNSQTKEDMVYLIHSSDVFGRSKGYVFDNSQSNAVYTIKKGKFYLGRVSGNDPYELVGSIQKDDEYGLKIVSELDSNNFLYVEGGGDLMTSGETVLSFLVAAGLFNWDDLTATNIKNHYELAQEDGLANAGGESIIKPNALHRSYHSEWVWDGRVLKQRWEKDLRREWIFDGETLKPYWESDINEEYIWDGQEFKPKWRNSSMEEWTLEDGVIKPIWRDSEKDEYYLNGHAIEPVYTSQATDWSIQGEEVPAPVLILILSGLAYR